MASEIYVSKASSVSFVIQNGPGTIAETTDALTGLKTDTDLNFHDTGIGEDVGNIGDFFNCNLSSTGYCQKWMWGDTIRFQFIYLNETTDLPPVVALRDVNGNYLAYYQPIDATDVHNLATQNLWSMELDTSELDEPTECTCYFLEIGSIAVDDTNTFVCADFGRFETDPATWNASTGGNNVLDRDGTYAHQGTFSGVVEANGAPSLGSNSLFFCDSPNAFTAGEIYQLSAWGYLESGTAICDPAQIISWSILSLTDAITISQTTMLGSQLDEWVNITITFQVGADTSGTPVLIMNALPNANGVFWIDQIELFETNTTPEAVSQKVCVCSDIPCSAQFFFAADGDDTEEMGIIGFGLDSVQSFNVGSSFRQFRFEVEDNETTRDSAGESSQIISRPQKVYTFRSDPIPSWEVEKIQLSLKLSNVLLRPAGNFSANSVYMVMHSDAVEVEPADGTDHTLFIATWDMTPKYYNFQKSNC